MKRFITSIACALSLCAVLSNPAQANDLIIGLTPYAASPEQAKERAVDTLQFLAGQIEPGESAQILDAYNVRSICTFSVPDRKAYRHEKNKLTVNAPCVRALLGAAQSAKQSAPVPDAVRLPDTLRFIGENYPAQTATDILIVGSPLYDDPREPSVSMAYGHVPGDGHLNAARGASPYSASSEGLYANMRVHLVATDAAWAINLEHAHFVKRLWALYVERQGGSLVTFTSDASAAFNRIASHAEAPPHDYNLAATTKLEMIPIRRDAGARTPIHQRALAQVPPAVTELRAASNVEIGITWDCTACDLDLYARPWRGAEVIYFNKTHTAEAQMFKDYRSSPEINNGLETIEFVVPLDLQKLLVAVNLYEGSPPDGIVHGEVRISIGERTWAAPFIIEAKAGTRTEGATEIFAGSPSEPGWTVIDIRKPLNLSE